MINLISKLNGWKTYITATVAILTALLAYLNHTINGTELIGAIFAAVQTMNIRHGMTTTATATAVQAGNPAAKISAVLFALMLLGSASGFAQTTNTTPTATNIISEIVNTIQPTAGIMYGVREHQIKDITSFQVVGCQNDKYKLVALDGNFLYAPTDMIGWSVTYPIGNFSSITKLNTTIPILSWLSQMNINVGYGMGWFLSGGSRTYDDGPIISGSIKF